VAITSVGYDGSIDEVQWAKLARHLGAEYAVEAPGDYQVSVVAGLDRTVSVDPGTAYAHGVLAVSDAAVTVQLPAIASGSRWDLIALRRDWQPPGGTSTVVFVQGTGSQTIPAGRLNSPGVTDDQPLSLVRVTAGQTTPTAVVDLRAWHGNGGLLAASADALAYLGTVGSDVRIGPVTWRRVLDAAGSPVWRRIGGPGARYTARVAGLSLNSGAPYVQMPLGTVAESSPYVAPRNGGREHVVQEAGIYGVSFGAFSDTARGAGVSDVRVALPAMDLGDISHRASGYPGAGILDQQRSRTTFLPAGTALSLRGTQTNTAAAPVTYAASLVVERVA
jgi:hypothetical protein